MRREGPASSAAAAAALLALLGAAPRAGAAAPLTTWVRTNLTAPCLDGSAAALYVKPGTGADADKVILFWEGGGWCLSLEDCLARSNTTLGSSLAYPPHTTGYSVRDLLQPDCAVNPRFCNYASAYAPYCDGASRSSRAAEPVVVDGKPLYFRGFDVLAATVDALLAGAGGLLPPLSATSELVVSGSSAGGLTTLLHLDYVAGRAQGANPALRVAGVPEVGFFVDAASIWDGRHVYTEMYQRVAAFGNVSGGLPEQVNADCAAAYPAEEDRWHCFMAQYTYPHVRTPTFLLQSQVDEWQAQNILAPDLDTSVAVHTYAPFVPCILHPGPPGQGGSQCNATQWAQWSGYAAQFFAALYASMAATPPDTLARSGGVITSCPIHTTAISGKSHSIVVGGRSMYDWLVAWYDSGAPKEGGAWTLDLPWPGDKSCPLPGAEENFREGF